jgi:tetratricopeptide (TPR) repeat protein
LQQSVQAETTRLATLRRPAPAVKPAANRAYDLDREARHLYREKKYDDALKKSQEASALKPKDAVLLNNLGFLYYSMGRYDEALPWLRKTLEIDPKRREAHGNIAELLDRMGRKQEAKQHYEQYLQLYPNSPKAEEFRRRLQTL